MPFLKPGFEVSQTFDNQLAVRSWQAFNPEIKIIVSHTFYDERFLTFLIFH